MKANSKNVEAHLKIHLLEGKTITHNQAQKLWGTNRLSEFIRRLRRKGMDIDMKMKSEGNDTFGVYRMVQRPKVDRIATRQYMEQV